MSRSISWEQINEDFSYSYCCNKNEIVVNDMIESILGFILNGSMANLSMFKILLDNVLCVYNPDRIHLFKKVFSNGEYRLEMKIIPMSKR